MWSPAATAAVPIFTREILACWPLPPTGLGWAGLFPPASGLLDGAGAGLFGAAGAVLVRGVGVAFGVGCGVAVAAGATVCRAAGVGEIAGVAEGRGEFKGETTGLAEGVAVGWADRGWTCGEPVGVLVVCGAGDAAADGAGVKVF